MLREPLRVPFGPYTVLTNPPPSAGGGLIGAGLRLAEQRGLGQEPFLSREHQLAVAEVLAAVSDLRQSGYDERLRADPASIRDLVAGDGIAAWPTGRNTIVSKTASGQRRISRRSMRRAWLPR